MNKFVKKFCLLALTPFVFCGCAPKEYPSGLTMTARIIEISSYIEIEIIKDDYNSGILWVLVDNLTPIKNAEGKSIALRDLKAGNKIEIVYNGQVMLSYPGKIVAKTITVLE